MIVSEHVKTRVGFHIFDRDHEFVWESFKRLGDAARAAGRVRVGAALLINVLRWNAIFEQTDPGANLKMCDHWGAYYARKYNGRTGFPLFRLHSTNRGGPVEADICTEGAECYCCGRLFVKVRGVWHCPEWEGIGGSCPETPPGFRASTVPVELGGEGAEPEDEEE